MSFLIDTGHAILNKWNMTEVLGTLKDRIRAYHVHDNFGDGDTHLKVGEGPTDWTKFFEDYKKYSPDARLVLEYARGPVSEIVKSIDVMTDRYNAAK